LTEILKLSDQPHNVDSEIVDRLSKALQVVCPHRHQLTKALPKEQQTR